ncbi:hypothetical protein Tco_0790472 [Tanacetum coccineum]
MDSQIISLNEELEDMRKKYNELRNRNASKNNMNDDTLMCERQKANSIQSGGYQNQNYHDSYLHLPHHDRNDSGKSLTELKNDVKNDLEYFKRRIRSIRTVHWKLYDRNDVKTTGVLHNKESKTMKQNEKNFQTKIKNMERKIDEWSKSQNVSSKQTDRTDPPPPQAQTEHVNDVFTGSGKSDDSLKIQKDPPPPIIVNNKAKKINQLRQQKRSITL